MPYKDKEINKECIRKYHQKHREEEKEYNKQYYKNHCEQIGEYYRKQLQYLQEYKLLKGCAMCGYNDNADILCFHHKENKKFTLSQFGYKNLETIKNEMKKCIVLCRSCHTKLHRKLEKENISISY